MEYPKYLYRGTTTNYLGPLGMINANSDSNRMYFADSPEEAYWYSDVQNNPNQISIAKSFLPNGRKVLVTIEPDASLKKKLHRSRYTDYEWYIEAGFLPRKYIVYVEPIR